jgi:hypothetical protein
VEFCGETKERCNMGVQELHRVVGSVYKYLGKAVEARDAFYRGMDEAAARALLEKQPNMGPEDAKYRFGKSVKGAQLIADNKWHMAQSRTFALASIASGMLQLVYEQQHTNKLLQENNALLTGLQKITLKGTNNG